VAKWGILLMQMRTIGRMPLASARHFGQEYAIGIALPKRQADDRIH
jgi:hypothetical protein